MSSKIYLDFETRSKAPIKNCGAYVYAEHESTDVLCLVLKSAQQKPMVWIPSWVFSSGLVRTREDYKKQVRALGLTPISDQRLTQTLHSEATLIGYNVEFEQAIWHEVMHKKYGFPETPGGGWGDTMAKAGYYALPRSLEKACEALQLPAQKDIMGGRVMRRLAQPNVSTGAWTENPEDFLRLIEYCADDVRATEGFDEALQDLPEEEQKVWGFNQKINQRGVGIDLFGVERIIGWVEEQKQRLLDEAKAILGFSPTQVEELRKWLEIELVRPVENVQKSTVEELLALPDLPEAVRRVLDIRAQVGKSSVSKFTAMKNRTSKDGRLRGMFLYHGATTGRFAGRGVQLQNLIRNSFSADEVDAMLYGEYSGDSILTDASRAVRGMLVPEQGKLFMCSDFSQIEARVLAWLSGHDFDLEIFRQDKDVYVAAATGIFSKPYDKITKDERAIGKVAVLALGYQGWTGAFAQFAKVYGVSVEEELAVDIIKNWRASHEEVCQFWSGVEDAARRAVKTGEDHLYRGVAYGVRGNFLCCRLPSGRLIRYFRPHIRHVVDKFDRKKEAIGYYGYDNKNGNRWGMKTTYGGKLTENIVQAVARDVFVEAMLRAYQRYGLLPVAHIHDEVIVEVEKKRANDRFLHEFENELQRAPEWAKGLPVKVADGWIKHRYQK